MAPDFIFQLKQSGLTGRGGAGFPTGEKWQMVKEAPGDKKYIVCNAAEGEPGVFKDGYILEHFPQDIVNGVRLALETIKDSTAYIYLRKDYYQKFQDALTELTKDLPVTLFEKTGGYLAGEETSLLEAIEGNSPEPRLKPPYPPQVGLFGCPTLINNLETFYHVSQIAKGKHQKTRFYTVGIGVNRFEGIWVEEADVYQLPEDSTIRRILEETGRMPENDFFVQSGGAASGEILLPDELDQKARGQGAIVIYDRKKVDLTDLLQRWATFFLEENCDKCVPCREGVYRIDEMLRHKKLDKKTLDDIFYVLKETSFCALGGGVVTPFKSLCQKILK